jgi:hypothetical protein
MRDTPHSWTPSLLFREHVFRQTPLPRTVSELRRRLQHMISFQNGSRLFVSLHNIAHVSLIPRHVAARAFGARIQLDLSEALSSFLLSHVIIDRPRSIVSTDKHRRPTYNEAAAGSTPLPRHGLRPCFLSESPLTLHRAILLDLALSLAFVPSSPFPTLVQSSCRELANSPNRGCDDRGSNGGWRREPGSTRDHTSEGSGADRRSKCADRCVFGPSHEPPDDELANVAECAQQGSRSQSPRSIGALRVDQIFEVSASIDECRVSLLFDRNIIFVNCCFRAAP